MGMFKSLLVSCIFFWCVQSASLANGELAVVVNVESSSVTITEQEVVSIFLGKKRELADGTKVVPLDQLEGQTVRSEFYSKVIQKTPTQLNSYWSRLIFAGKGRPPFAVSGDEEVLELVSANPNMMGYIDIDSLHSSDVSDQVKVLLTIP